MKMAARVALSLSLVAWISLQQFGYAQDSSGLRSNAIETPGWGGNDEALIASYQSKTDALGKFYGFDFRAQPWRHEVLNICSEFKMHRFVRYQRVDQTDIGFIAVFPVTNGRVRLIRLNSAREPSAELPLVRSSTAVTFNAVWREEYTRVGDRASILNTNGGMLATCYAEVAGERTASKPDASSVSDPIVVDCSPVASVSSIWLELASPDPEVSINLLLNFDKRNLVDSAQRVVSAKIAVLPN